MKGAIPADIIYRDEEVVAFRDIHPQAPVHFLVVPSCHISTLMDVGESEDVLLGKMMRVASKIAAQQKIAQDGFRAILNCNKLGGQDVMHIHLHVLGGRMMGWPPG